MDNEIFVIHFSFMKTFIGSFDWRFLYLHNNSCELIQKIPEEKLYWQPHEIKRDFPLNSCGEYILRSAGRVEQTFGGITVRLWDDPFEWTLPEQLSTKDLVLNYLGEVEETRRRGFALFESDDDLRREISTPKQIETIFNLLLRTLAFAENEQGRAAAIARFFMGKII